jgi:tetratricopeptide (TPR) repeat protein
LGEEHAVVRAGVETDARKRQLLEEWKRDVRNRFVSPDFDSAADLKSKVLQSLAEWRAADATRTNERAKKRKSKRSIVSPPALLAVPDFVSGHKFLGRVAELQWLDQWMASSDPVMVIEAMGGTGKSALAWQWLGRQITQKPNHLAGAVWFSLYESGAGIKAFAADTLAYATGLPRENFLGLEGRVLAQALVAELQRGPFLLVLDGLERILVAYDVFDPAHVRDEDVGEANCECIKPSDADFLRLLVSATPSKILITSRLMPSALTNHSHQPLPGVQRRTLHGMEPDDALSMMHALGVRGDDSALKLYLAENFDNHPLVLGIVAGMVNDYARDPGNFDRWLHDPLGGASLHLSRLDLKQRKTHILAAALKGLEPRAKRLLSCIAAGFATSVPFDTLVAVYAFVTRNQDDDDLFFKIDPERERAALPELIEALHTLQNRGLLQWDRRRNTYDVHPVVSGYAFDALEASERVEFSSRIADYFEGRPRDRYPEAKSLQELQNSIGLFRALVSAERYEEAAALGFGGLLSGLLFSLEAHHLVLSLLRPMFPKGWDGPSCLSESGRLLALTDAGLALWRLHQVEQAHDVHALALLGQVESKNLRSAKSCLTNLGLVCFDENKIALSFRTFGLAQELANIISAQDGLARAWFDLMSNFRMVGIFDKAEEAYAKFKQYPTPSSRDVYRVGMIEQELCWLRFYQGTLTDELLDQSEEVARAANTRTSSRSLACLRGELALSRGENEKAIAAFERVMELSRAMGLPTDEFEAKLAIALARHGDRDRARSICQQVSGDPKPRMSILPRPTLRLETATKRRLTREKASCGRGRTALNTLAGSSCGAAAKCFRH